MGVTVSEEPPYKTSACFASSSTKYVVRTAACPVVSLVVVSGLSNYIVENHLSTLYLSYHGIEGATATGPLLEFKCEQPTTNSCLLAA